MWFIITEYDVKFYVNLQWRYFSVKAAIFFATGFEEIEAVTIIDVLRRGGVPVTMISISGNEVVEGAHGIPIRCTDLFYMMDYSVFDMLILPGGMPGTANLAKHEGLCQLLVDFNVEALKLAEAQKEQTKKIAAICAAPSVLGQLGILEGKKATCYPGFEDKLTGCQVVNQAVVKDGHIITANGAASALAFAFEVLKEFVSEDEVVQLASAMLYKQE